MATSPEPDAVLLAAVDLARAALLEITPSAMIGPLVGSTAHAEHVLSLHFASLLPGYPDWRWTATLSRVDGQSEPNVLETELLPGDDSVLAPEWTPWADRLADYSHAQEEDAELIDTEPIDDDGIDTDDFDDEDVDDADLDDAGDDLDDHILDDDILHEAEAGEKPAPDVSVLVRPDEPPRASVGATTLDIDEERLTVVILDDSVARASVYFDEDAPLRDE